MLRNAATSPTAHDALLEVARESAPEVSEQFDDDDYEHQSSDPSQHPSVLDNDTGETNDGARELKETIIKKEEGNVRKSRWLVGLAMTICAVAVTVATYVLAKRSDQHSFELEVRKES